MAYGELIGKIPGILGKITTFVQSCREGSQTKLNFVDVVVTLRTLFEPFCRYLPTEDELREVAGRAYDKYWME